MTHASLWNVGEAPIAGMGIASTYMVPVVYLLVGCASYTSNRGKKRVALPGSRKKRGLIDRPQATPHWFGFMLFDSLPVLDNPRVRLMCSSASAIGRQVFVIHCVRG